MIYTRRAKSSDLQRRKQVGADLNVRATSAPPVRTFSVRLANTTPSQWPDPLSTSGRVGVQPGRDRCIPRHGGCGVGRAARIGTSCRAGEGDRRGGLGNQVGQVWSRDVRPRSRRPGAATTRAPYARPSRPPGLRSPRISSRSSSALPTTAMHKRLSSVPKSMMLRLSESPRPGDGASRRQSVGRSRAFRIPRLHRPSRTHADPGGTATSASTPRCSRLVTSTSLAWRSSGAIWRWRCLRS